MLHNHAYGGGLDSPTIDMPSWSPEDYTETFARSHLFVGPLQDRIVYLYSKNDRVSLVVLGVYSVTLDQMVFFAARRENIKILLPSRLVYLIFPDGVDFLGTLASTVSLNCNLFFFTAIDQNVHTLNYEYAYKNYISRNDDPDSIKRNIPRRVQQQERPLEYDSNASYILGRLNASYIFITLRPEDFDNPRQLALEYLETEGAPYLTKIGVRQGKNRFHFIETLVRNAPDQRIQDLQHNFSTFLFELQSNGVFTLNSFQRVINHQDTYMNTKYWLQVYQDICRSPTTVGNISMFQRVDRPSDTHDSNVVRRGVMAAIYACSLWFKRIGCRVQQLYHQNAPEINSIPILKSMSDVASCINSLLPNQYELFRASNPVTLPLVELDVSRDTFKPPLMSMSALEKDKVPEMDASFYRHVFIQNADGEIIIYFNRRRKIVCSLPNVGAVVADGDVILNDQSAVFISDVIPIHPEINENHKERMQKNIHEKSSTELIRKRPPEAVIYMTELSKFYTMAIIDSNFPSSDNDIHYQDYDIHLDHIFKYGDSTRILSYYALLPDSNQMKFIIYKEPLLYFTGHTAVGHHATMEYGSKIQRYGDYDEIESKFAGDPQYKRHPQFISSPDVPDMITRSVADAASAVPGVENNYYIDYMSEYGVEVQDDVYTANAGSENLFEARGEYLEISGNAIQENFNMPTLRISRFTPDAVELYKNLMLEGHMNQMLYAIGQVLRAQGLL
jgi:hypothetical protein